MEHDLSSDIEDETLHYPKYKDVGIRVTDEFDESMDENPSYTSGESHHSVYPTSLTGEKIIPPPAIISEEVITGNAHGYTPSLPYQEAGPTSNVWRAYLDERFIHDTDIFGNQRGEINIHPVFAGLFSAVVTIFISQSSVNLQPDYQQISALLLFNQINIQPALANGTSLGLITTSGADPTAPFTPRILDSVINGLWYLSLALSLEIASFPIVADQ
ncbi:hypothetical protein F5146DRAFT_1170227 [Armillaria mellea]|nr:hypothetical protein F5146DRAFT_1170227 [Armillaria mellea]